MRVVGKRSVVADSDQLVAARENIHYNITLGQPFQKITINAHLQRYSLLLVYWILNRGTKIY